MQTKAFVYSGGNYSYAWAYRYLEYEQFMDQEIYRELMHAGHAQDPNLNSAPYGSLSNFDVSFLSTEND